MLGRAHALHAAGSDDAAFAGADLLGRQRHRAQARATELVDAEGGLFVRHAGGARGLAGRAHALTSGKDLAEDQLVHVGGRDAGAFECGLQGHGGQRMRGQRAQRAVEAADRRPGGGCDNDVVHDGFSPLAAPSGHVVQAAVNVNRVAGHPGRGAPGCKAITRPPSAISAKRLAGDPARIASGPIAKERQLRDLTGCGRAKMLTVSRVHASGARPNSRPGR